MNSLKGNSNDNWFHSSAAREEPRTKIIPYDGFAVKSKKIKVSDLVHNTMISNKKLGRNIIFDKPFPLIKVVSNRKNINRYQGFVKNVLASNRNQLDQAAKKLIKYSSFNLIKKGRGVIQAHYPQHQRNKDDSGFKPILIDDAAQTVRNSSTFELTSCESLNHYSTTSHRSNMSLIIHQHNRTNKEFLLNRRRGEYNYVLNAYKVHRKDVLMNKIWNDVTLLKFNQHLRLLSEL